MKEFDFVLNQNLFEKINNLKDKKDKDLSTLIGKL